MKRKQFTVGQITTALGEREAREATRVKGLEENSRLKKFEANLMLEIDATQYVIKALMTLAQR